MKNIFRNIAIASVIASGIVATSCEDMMTVDTGDKTYVNAQDTLYSYLGIMRCMQNVAERQVILGEIRGDLVSPSEYATDTLHAISNFENPEDGSCSMLQISDYYNVINNCNAYIYNCDTSAVKSNVKYMIPEYAQVKAIRAWAYLQLVKNYERVPFITEPINNLSVVENFDYNNNLVDKDNLIDKIIEDGILSFIDTKYPSYGDAKNEYGAWDNGFTQISARMCFIPIRVVLADMYLLRGADKTDYEKAAKYYYDFLKNEETPMPLQYAEQEPYISLDTYLYRNTGGWGQFASQYSYNSEAEVVTTIPGSANAGLGTMITRIADIFGYTPTSSQSTNETSSSESTSNTTAESSFETSGAITVSYNYKRQYGPSEAYSDVCNDQTIVNYTRTTTAEPTASYIMNTDARTFWSVEDYAYEGKPYPLCSKASSGTTFYYSVPIYRKTLIWLRLAEAINRAGYPEFAFAILKDGINQYSLPRIVDRYPERYDAQGRLILYKASTDHYLYKDLTTGIFHGLNEEGEWEEHVIANGYVVIRDTIKNDSIAYGSAGQLYYAADTTRISKFTSFLDFRDEVWNSTYGIHAKGCGFGKWTSSNKGEVTTNISGYRDSVYYDYSKLLLKQGVNIKTAPVEDVINAVENIIVDELALETAFEGNRFTDLVRIANHKDASGYNGTEWLATKIANRGTKKATEKSPAVEGYNADIESKLMNKANWYFKLPAWKK
ncbi:MAG: RagB/SusD family nutrient uptake outer membrane protein [Bacteroidaceae bacterium]|nr:RagB/SusD family nutrient uptake outer membrane protein [Bacteroidaceae bacterium]